MIYEMFVRIVVHIIAIYQRIKGTTGFQANVNHKHFIIIHCSKISQTINYCLKTHTKSRSQHFPLDILLVISYYAYTCIC